MKRVILMVHLSDGDNNTVSDFLVNRDSLLFDSFFDEEDAFLGFITCHCKKGVWVVIVGFNLKIVAGYGLG